MEVIRIESAITREQSINSIVTVNIRTESRITLLVSYVSNLVQNFRFISKLRNHG